MLDAATKRSIDSARDILVGKVPDPKAQVEQITTALIYKFMDDMSKEAEELGGKAKFFTDDLKNFAWSKLLDARHSGKKRMDLYVRAIAAFTKAKQLPVLFRNFFKGAFLPYRDPETLSLFLKEINNFVYDHSENLGNAFEYLLSVLGSQGDAGQFRTPRHIIDFIVEVIDPKKNETILDPACGTAGFLISAYKHILKHNSSDFKLKKGGKAAPAAEKTYSGDRITPSEKKKLMRNFAGYDISPDMVKLSLVNMYLHGFQDPQIHEYDTLTSEDRWGEQFDVIMANPPFMTPKGGIRPHSRFSVQARRSEVLFVDYILEHLNLKGRAGIIVPEGIIFKTENAYKQLRQMLIEDGLFSVVSLPSGVFNPYSGVKTSVLFFDNQLAKKTDEILFVKIENDGFDLGAQRRKIDRNDLSEALEILEAWKQEKKKESNLALWVKKEKISESGDYNLTGERYKETTIRKNQKWSLVELGDICKIFNGNRPKGGAVSSGILSIGGEHINPDGSFNLEKPKYVPEKFFKELKRGKLEVGDILVVKDGATTGKMGYFDSSSPFRMGAVNEHVFILRVDTDKCHSFYLYQFLKSKKGNAKILQHKTGAAQGGINLSIKKIETPLPPLEVQKEIVEQVEVKQKAIHHAKEVIKNLERERRYFGKKVEKLDGVEYVALGDKTLFQIESGGTPNTNAAEFWNGEINWVTLVDLPQDNYITELQETRRKITAQGLKKSSAKLLPPKTILVSSRATIGRVAIAKAPTATNQGFKNIIVKDESKVLPFFVAAWLNSKKEKLKQLATGGTFGEVSKSKFFTIKIPLPSLAVQKQLVAEIEKEEEIITSSRRLIDLMERKIEDVLSEI